MTRLQPAVGVEALLLVLASLVASGAEANQDTKAVSSLQSLTFGLNSTNPATRFYAVHSLGRLGGSPLVDPLVKALHDPDA